MNSPIFPDTDGRVVFTIPYEREYTLIGTTEREFTGDPLRWHRPE
jgi:glycerol-3-phosphate dehydrogenase